MRLYPPDSYRVTCSCWSGRTSMWIRCRAPVLPPYQAGTGSNDQGRAEREVVDLDQAAERAGSAGSDGVVTRDHREQAGVIALLGRGPVPAEDEVVRGDRVAVREHRVASDVKCVREPVG